VPYNNPLKIEVSDDLARDLACKCPVAGFAHVLASNLDLGLNQFFDHRDMKIDWRNDHLELLWVEISLVQDVVDEVFN
jgi:hypothetical protein